MYNIIDIICVPHTKAISRPGDGGRDRKSIKQALEEIKPEGKKFNVKGGAQLTQFQLHRRPKRKKLPKAKASSCCRFSVSYR